jgi:hypothetical protein
MPHFTLQFQIGGPQLELYVGVSQPRHQVLQQANMPIPQPILIRGLLDTGASTTAIDSGIILALGLQPTGSMLILTPSTGSSPHPANTFDVSIIIPVANLTFTVPAMQVFESSLNIQGFQVLIGRDILSNCLFVYDGRANIFSLAF